MGLGWQCCHGSASELGLTGASPGLTVLLAAACHSSSCRAFSSELCWGLREGSGNISPAQHGPVCPSRNSDPSHSVGVSPGQHTQEVSLGSVRCLGCVEGAELPHGSVSMLGLLVHCDTESPWCLWRSPSPRLQCLSTKPALFCAAIAASTLSLSIKLLYFDDPLWPSCILQLWPLCYLCSCVNSYPF